MIIAIATVTTIKLHAIPVKHESRESSTYYSLVVFSVVPSSQQKCVHSAAHLLFFYSCKASVLLQV